MDDDQLFVLLADDDQDDCLLFTYALEEIPIKVKLATVFNGEQLMDRLNSQEPLPDVIFLDLNMPRKNGIECLAEIKSNQKLKKLPIIMFSTSYEQTIVNDLYNNGSHFYIRKPNEYTDLKAVIYKALSLIKMERILQPSREDYVLTARK